MRLRIDNSDKLIDYNDKERDYGDGSEKAPLELTVVLDDLLLTG